MIDGCDSAIIGHVDNPPRVVYSYDLLIDHFAQEFEGEVTDDAEVYDVAAEWVGFNILGAYVGEDGPLILFPGGRAEIDEVADNE